MVKTMNQEVKVDNTLPQCSIALASSIFIELSNSLVGEDLTHFLCQRNHWNTFFNLEPFCCQSHPPMGGVFNLLFLAYAQWCCQDKPPMNYVLWIMTISFSKNPIIANYFWWGHSIWIAAIHSNAHNPSQMQNMERKYNGHAWNKLVTTK